MEDDGGLLYLVVLLRASDDWKHSLDVLWDVKIEGSLDMAAFELVGISTVDNDHLREEIHELSPQHAHQLRCAVL